MAGEGRKFFISNFLKQLEKPNIFRRQVMQISIRNRCLLRRFLESDLKVSKFVLFLEI